MGGGSFGDSDGSWNMGLKVVFATPTVTRPFEPNIKALRASVPVLDEAGIEHALVYEIGNPYISAARATMTRKALDAKADVIVYLDHDLSWRPEDLLKLIQTDGDVVAGLYRFKNQETSQVEYMGVIEHDEAFRPIVRQDGCIKGKYVPGGFLKVTKEAIGRFMASFPDLCYGPKYQLSVDLFNHGAHGGMWWGEDYAFSRRWGEIGGEIWIVPDLSLTHYSADKEYPGNFHEFLLRQPGGSRDPNRMAA